MDKKRLGIMFVMVVWVSVLGIFGYNAYVKLMYDIEYMNFKFKTFDEIMNENP